MIGFINFIKFIITILPILTLILGVCVGMLIEGNRK